MWEIRGIITIGLSVYKKQIWEGTTQDSGYHNVREKQNIEGTYPF